MDRDFITPLQCGYTEMSKSEQSLNDLKIFAEKNHAIIDTIIDEVSNMIEHNELRLNLAEQCGLYQIIEVLRSRELCAIGVITNLINRLQKKGI
jgi:hypothetical protein